MKIGIFDSGLGGLFVMRAIVKQLPRYEYVYLGDTKRVPYGNRSQETIFALTKDAVRFLFSHGCKLVIIACNTASARALRKIQREFLPRNFPNRRVLGVIIPSVEEAVGFKKIGVLGTRSTVSSQTYSKELRKKIRGAKIIEQAAPMLVPLIENDEVQHAKDFIKKYTRLLRGKVDVVILGCTHYGVLKKQIQKALPKARIIAQEDIIPKKLGEYLQRHPEIEKKLHKTGKRIFYVTDLTPELQKHAKNWFGKSLHFKKIEFAK